MGAFIDAHRGADGVEPICAVRPIAPSVYDKHRARARDPERQPARARHDASLAEHIGRVWREHREVYGVRKVWKQLRREGSVVARGTVARLRRRLGLAGAVEASRMSNRARPGVEGALLSTAHPPSGGHR